MQGHHDKVMMTLSQKLSIKDLIGAEKLDRNAGKTWL